MRRSGSGARWGALIEEHEGSGETVAEFCVRRGLARPTFYEWRRRLKARPAPAAFVPVHVALGARVPRGPSGVEVVLGGGRRLRLERGFDPAVLSAAVAALEGAAC